MADFFEAIFNRKSEKVLDRLAKIACSYLPADMQAECKEHRSLNRKNATKKNEAPYPPRKPLKIWRREWDSDPAPSNGFHNL
jgi:hypothetical protein